MKTQDYGYWGMCCDKQVCWQAGLENGMLGISVGDDMESWDVAVMIPAAQIELIAKEVDLQDFPKTGA
jgi:hypothetical protein